MYHNEAHFKNPFSYCPDRFLGDPRFASDNRDALQPFHVGPRNCVGRKYGWPNPHNTLLHARSVNSLADIDLPSLAYAEMRLILARVIFNFDMRIADESRNWMDQKVWNLWKKGPLLVHLTPSVR